VTAFFVVVVVVVCVCKLLSYRPQLHRRFVLTLPASQFISVHLSSSHEIDAGKVRRTHTAIAQ